MGKKNHQGNSGCATLILVVLLVLGYNWGRDSLDRLFTFNQGVSSVDFNQYKQQYYAADSTELMHQQGFESIDGRMVTWRVRVYEVDEDGELRWCAEQDQIFDTQGEKRWLSDCSAVGEVYLTRGSTSPRVNEVITLSFIPYDASDNNRINIKGFDGIVR